MASDYAREGRRPDHPKPERAPEQPSDRIRSVFAGFRPSTVAQEPMVTGVANEQASELQQAVRRYDAAWWALPKWKSSTFRFCRIRYRRASVPARGLKRSVSMRQPISGMSLPAIRPWRKMRPLERHARSSAPYRSKRRYGPIRNYAPTVL